jgi:mRNA interferase RelE/StbE
MDIKTCGSACKGGNQMNEILTTPKGEYLRLKALEEDVADLNSAADALARIKAGTEDLIPSAVVD